MKPVQTRPQRTDKPSAFPDREFNRRAIFVAGLVGAGALMVLVVWLAGSIFLLAFAGVLLAVLLQALSGGLSERTRLSYGWSYLAVLTTLAIILVLTTWLVGARLAQKFSRLGDLLPAAIQNVVSFLEGREWGSWLLEHVPDVEEAVPRTGFFSRITGFASQTFDFVVNLAIVLFVGIYGAAEPDRYRRGLLKLVPQAKRQRADEVIGAITEGLHWWLVGRFFAMAVIAVLTWIGLTALGVPLALPLALIAGALQIIPNVGPILSGIPALLVGFTVGARTALYVVALYTAIQVVESYILTPLVQRQAVRLPPALTIVAMALLGVLAGAIGLFVAAPLTVVALIAVRMLYVEDVLGDRPNSAEGG